MQQLNRPNGRWNKLPVIWSCWGGNPPAIESFWFELDTSGYKRVENSDLMAQDVEAEIG